MNKRIGLDQTSLAQRLTKLPTEVFGDLMRRAITEDVDFSRPPARNEIRDALRQRNVTLLKEDGAPAVFDTAVNLYVQVLASKRENVFQCPTCKQRFLRRGRVVGTHLRLEREFVSFAHKIACPLCRVVAIDPIAHAPRVKVRAAARVL